MKTLATTKIRCGTARHAVTLFADGNVQCDCGQAGLDAGDAIAGKLMLGGTGGVIGCAGLVALVQGAPGLAREARGSKEPSYGVWKPLVEQYRLNPVYQAALDLAASSSERGGIHEKISTALSSIKLGHGLSKRAFAERLRPVWDVPLSELPKFVVASFSDDRWEVPYTPDWAKLSEQGLSVIDGKFVCGFAEDGTIYAITKHPDDEAWWVMPHKLQGRKLVELAA